MESHLSIDEVAKRTGLTAYTLRYYERIGLIAPVARAAGGQRRYAASDMDWIAFLLRLRTTHMPIGKMQTFAHVRGAGDATVPARRQMLEEHLSAASQNCMKSTAKPASASSIACKTSLPTLPAT
jgi:DNA-binding transcriptional MerR regulator